MEVIHVELLDPDSSQWMFCPSPITGALESFTRSEQTWQRCCVHSFIVSSVSEGTSQQA